MMGKQNNFHKAASFESVFISVNNGFRTEGVGLETL